MDRARIFVSADTGPLHLAVARGRTVVALFGPADPARTGPWGVGHRVVRFPKWDASAPRIRGRMQDVTVAAVLEAVDEVLARST